MLGGWGVKIQQGAAVLSQFGQTFGSAMAYSYYCHAARLCVHTQFDG